MINYNNPPEKVEIYFYKNKTLIQAFWSVSGLIGSTYLFLVYEVKLLLIPIVVSLIALVFDLRKIFRKAPVIIISKNGILFKNDFLDWKNVTKYEIIEENYRQKTHSLKVETFQKSTVINIDGLNFIPEDIRSLIILYKGINKD